MFNPEKEIHEHLFWHYPHYHRGSGMVPASAIRSGDYKLIEWHEPKLLQTGKAIELFDLKNDIGETNDISEQNKAKAAELEKLLNDWKKKVKAEMPEINQQY